MKRSDMVRFLSEQLDAYISLDDGYKEKEPGGELLLSRLESMGMRPPLPSGDLAGYIEDGEWEPETLDPKDQSGGDETLSVDDLASKDIYLRKGDQIVGLHAVGHAVPCEFDNHELDGSITRIKTDFFEIEKWGNNYNEKLEMIGRGSFRIFDLTLEHTAKAYEEDGWVRFVPGETK